ncbi:MAG: hypothetical protein IBJ07_12375 [Rhizobiaceae bacterium]|nr:hypothetical protein [Rhizobiaceae bacterium]
MTNPIETKSAAIVAFPLTRRIGKIRAVATNLAGKNGSAAEAYWKQSVATIANQMDRNGVDQDEIRQELREFFHAVQREMVRMAGENRETGGAA